MAPTSSSGRAAAPPVIAAAVGALVAAVALSAYAVRARRRRKRPPSGGDDGSNDERCFYELLGLSEDDLPSHIQRELHKERKRRAKVEMLSMKSPMYDNVFMLDRLGEKMCTISMKKARWYVRKGIAEWSSSPKIECKDCDSGSNSAEKETKAIRLLFEHNGSNSQRGTSENLYLRSAKQNICVACGDDGHHMRHYIVPYSYRALLPEEYKSHMSHDIVILCPDCHVDCERHSKRRMKRMENELRSKMGSDALDVSPVIEDPHLYHIRSCAIALVKWKDKMPSGKVHQYEREVREFLASTCNNQTEKVALLQGAEELTKLQLQKACGANYRVKNPNYVPGSEVVVRSLKDVASIEEFIRGWREHFIETVDPQHMPAGWRVDNPVVCRSQKDDGDREGMKTW